MLFGISGNLLRRLQAVQNAAARLVTGTQRHKHITPVLRQLHWLPVRQRIEFKLAVLVYKVLIGLSSQCLADDCQLTSTAGRRRLRSSNVTTYEVPRTRTSLGDRLFTVAGPRLWNNLPLHLRDSEHTFLEFCRLLKTHLFCWGQRCLVTVCLWAPYKFAFTLHYICTLSAVTYSYSIQNCGEIMQCMVELLQFQYGQFVCCPPSWIWSEVNFYNFAACGDRPILHQHVRFQHNRLRYCTAVLLMI